MKRQYLILIAFSGLHLTSYASTGSSADEGYLFLGVVGILLILLGIVSLFDYLKKNGKKLLYKTISFIKEKTNSVVKYLKKVFSDKFDFSFLKFQQ
ncbi:MAG: hypothetical protein ABF242_03905 [Flavobacteriales bacterium]